MKINRFFLTSLALILATFCHSQKLKTLYYTDQWELTTQGAAKYYRICLFDTIKTQFIGEVKDFAMDGQLIMSGSYQDGIKNGPFTFYYPSGQIESEGVFQKNMRTGTWKYFFPDGKPLREVRFTGEDFFVVSFYNQNGELVIQNGTGEWHFIYEWYGFPLKFEVKGNFQEGKKVGEWICGFVNGELLYKEIFKNGVFKSGYLFNPDGSKKEKSTEEFQNKFIAPFKFEVTEKFIYRDGLTRNNYPFFSFLPVPYSPAPAFDTTGYDKKVFLVVEQPPEFVGGLEAMYKFIAMNMKYPASARKRGIEGSVFVGFIIDADGVIREASIIKGISVDCNDEALRVIKMMPKWNPGIQSGRPVRVKFVLPIKFKIDEVRTRPR